MLVLYIGDNTGDAEFYRERVADSATWRTAQFGSVTHSDALSLYPAASEAIRSRFDPGPSGAGVLLLDLRWGAAGPTMGCDLLWWLRATGYQQAVVLCSSYIESGHIDQSVQAKLPTALGWQPFDLLHTFGRPLPEPLSEDEARRATEEAVKLIRRRPGRVLDALDQIWAHVRRAAYGIEPHWYAARDLVEDLAIPHQSLAYSRACAALKEAVDREAWPDVKQALGEVDQAAVALSQ
jgi:hypothetical protein